MGKSVEELMRQYGPAADEARKRAAQNQSNANTDPTFGGVGGQIDPVTGNMQKPEQDTLLMKGFTKALNVASTPGQYMMGVMKYVQTTQLTGQPVTLEGMATSGSEQVGILHQSQNLTELGANVISGAELWKRAPGALGDFFRRETATSNAVLFALGIGTEILVDPSTYLTAGIGGVARTAATKTATAAAKGTITAAEAAAQTAKIGKTASIANNVAMAGMTGGLSLGLQGTGWALRTVIGRSENALRAVAQSDSANTMMKEKAAGVLNMLFSRSASADQNVRQTIASARALESNGGRFLLQADDRVSKIVNMLPKGARDHAQKDIFTYLTNETRDPDTAKAAYDRLIAMGVNRKDIALAAASNAKGQKYLFDMMAEAGEDVSKMQDHVMRSYVMFYGDPTLQRQWGRYLREQATDAKFWLNQDDLGNILRANLGKGALKNQVNPGTNSPVPVGAPSGPGKKTFPEMMSTTREFTPPAAGRELSTTGEFAKTPVVRQAETEAASKVTAKRDFAAKTVQTLDAEVDKLQQRAQGLRQRLGDFLPEDSIAIAPQSGRGSKKLKAEAAERNRLSQGFHSELKSVEEKIAKITQRRESVAASLQGHEDHLGTLSARMQQGTTPTGRPNANSFDQGDPWDMGPGSFLLNVPKAIWEGGIRQKKIVDDLDVDDFMGELGKFWTGGSRLVDEDSTAVGVFGRTAPPVFETEQGLQRFARVNGIQGARSGQEVIEMSKKKTLDELTEFVTRYGQAKNLSGESVEALTQRTANSIVHVPGSAEFAAAFESGGTKFAGGLDNYGRTLLTKAGINMQGANMGVFEDRTLVEPFRRLLGEIDRAGPALEYQARTQVKSIARAKMYRELVDRGAVLFDDLADDTGQSAFARKGWTKIPEDESYGAAAGGWMKTGDAVAIDSAFKNFDTGWTGGFLGKLSGVFKRAQVIYDPSAWAAQFLGNVAFLDAAGYKPLGFMGVDGALQWKRAAAVLARQDARYEQMINSGLDVAMHNLDEAYATRLNGDVLRHVIEDRSDAPGFINGLMSRIWNATDEAKRAVRRPADAAALGAERTAVTDVDNITADTLATANQRGAAIRNASSAGAMFAYSDQLTRVFAYNRGLDRAERIFKQANPEAARVFKDGVPDFQALRGTVDDAEIGRLENTWNLALKDNAQMANDVALNYHDAPLIAEYASRSGVVPFAKFAWLSTGRTAEWLFQNPAIFARYHRISRNAGEAFWDAGEEDRQTYMQGLPEGFRQALNIPLPMQDSFGRPMALNTTRWLPFSGLMNAAYQHGDGSQPEPALTSLFGVPMLGMVADAYSALSGQDVKAPGIGVQTYGRPEEQSPFAAMAGVIAKNFMPAALSPGGRQMQLLARALEQSAYSIDPRTGEPATPGIGQFPEGITNPLAAGIHAYANAPQHLGAALDPNGGRATPIPREQESQRGTSTVGGAAARMFIPGAGVASDPERVLGQTLKRIDARTQQAEAQLAAFEDQFKYTPMTDDDQAKYQSLQSEIIRLSAQRARVSGSFKRPGWGDADDTTLGK